MIRIWRRCAAVHELVAEADFALSDDVVWIELLEPTRAEELTVERALGLGLPTREDMEEIELSSRLYRINGATFMTALAVCRPEGADGPPITAPVTFVLAGERLVTVRYVHPTAFDIFAAHAERSPELCGSGRQVFAGLLDAMVDRLADLLEHLGAEIEATSAAIFHSRRDKGLQPLMLRLGQHQNFGSKAHESLVSLSRVAGFAALSPQLSDDAVTEERLRSIQSDAQSLVEHVGYVSGNLSFLLDAAVGLVGVEQNKIARIFSMTALILMPPTLIGSIYGMNFDHMPELRWGVGYPIALILMVISGLIPFLWIRHKRWL